jgi:glycosyltransferase involved in cell wall biosynthesis
LNNPLVSIVLTNFNSEKYIRDTINSVLVQTYQNFELIIVDDCSTDDSINVINSFLDKRIYVYKNAKNLGISLSANLGLSVSKGMYICRLDSDDLWHPRKLELQTKYMESHPKIGFLFTWASKFGYITGIQSVIPPTHKYIKASFLFTSSVVHSSVMFRSSILKKFNGLYNENIRASVDYDLWTKMIGIYGFYCLPKILVRYRIHDNQLSSYDNSNQMKNADIIRDFYLNINLFNYDESFSRIHNEICRFKVHNISDIKLWANRITVYNKQRKHINTSILKFFVKKYVILNIRHNSPSMNLKELLFYFYTSLSITFTSIICTYYEIYKIIIRNLYFMKGRIRSKL